MKTTEKDQNVKIEMSRFQAVILHMILSYMKEWYFEKLNNVAKRGPGIIHPDVIKDVYKDILKATKL